MATGWESSPLWKSEWRLHLCPHRHISLNEEQTGPGEGEDHSAHTGGVGRSRPCPCAGVS